MKTGSPRPLRTKIAYVAFELEYYDLCSHCSLKYDFALSLGRRSLQKASPLKPSMAALYVLHLTRGSFRPELHPLLSLPESPAGLFPEDVAYTLCLLVESALGVVLKN